MAYRTRSAGDKGRKGNFGREFGRIVRTVGDAILEESSGNILVGGTLESPQTGQDILLGNLTATGQSEINWNGGNHLELNGATGDCRVNDVKVAANGQILVAATITLGTREPGCMIRRNADGSADAGFGFGGFGELANATYFRPKSVKPLPNGTMILSGVGKTTFSSSSP